MSVQGAQKYWLMKAEPNSRILNGKDVKFSIDDFESVGSTPWEGVRNYEARNLMKDMTIGDKILFYHSNCKNPGIAGFAEVSREAYLDYTAWDSTHPYFDEKSDKDNPKWFMVDAKFVSRARHFVPLCLLRHLADLPSAEPPEAVSYVGEEGVNAIKAMPLITRGRLSVQKVPRKCWDVIHMMAENGGWDNMSFKKKRATKTKVHLAQCDEDEDAGGHDVAHQPRRQVPQEATVKRGRKRKASTSTTLEHEAQILAPSRRSLRRRK